MPPYAFKELLLINSSITNCDPGNINETIEQLKSAKIVCSVVSLSAALFILQHLAKSTQGQFFMAKNKEHFEEIAQKYLVPQFTQAEMEAEKDTAQLIKIAFPSILFADDAKRPCHCHNKFVYQFLECPNCKGIMCMNNFYKESSGGQAEGQQDLLDSFEGNQILPQCRFCNILFVSSAKL